MKVYSNPFYIPAQSKKKTSIKLTETQRLMYFHCPGEVNVTITKDDTINSQKKAVKEGSQVIVAPTHWIPVFSSPGKEVEIEMESFDNPVDSRISFMIVEEGELELVHKGIKDMWWIGADDFGKVMQTGSKLTLFKNNYDFPVWVIALVSFGISAPSVKFKLLLDDECIGDFEGFGSSWVGLDAPIPIYQFINPGSKLILDIEKHLYSENCMVELMLSKTSVTLQYDLLYNVYDPFATAEQATCLAIFQLLTPVTPSEPPTPPGTIPPYPSEQDDEKDIFEPTPPDVPPDITTTQKPAGIKEPTKIILPGETPVVQPMPSPYGGVRPTADIKGRQRVSNVSIKYEANRLEVTDTSEYILFQLEPIKTLSVYAKKGDWKIKILTVHDQLSAKSISDMATISIPEGQAIEIDIEAVQVNAVCENASGDNPGIIYWEAEL